MHHTHTYVHALAQGDDTATQDRLVSQWQQDAVIASAEKASSELYHFVVPLRAHYLPSGSLKPVVLFLKQK